MKKRQLEDIGRLVHSTRTVLHKYRYITLTVDSDAKRKDTAEWLDWVRLVKRYVSCSWNQVLDRSH